MSLFSPEAALVFEEILPCRPTVREGEAGLIRVPSPEPRAPSPEPPVPRPELRHVRGNLAVQMMHVPANALQFVAGVGLERGLTFFLELTHLRFERAFVDADGGVMVMAIDAECLAQRGKQMILVHLRVPLH